MKRLDHPYLYMQDLPTLETVLGPGRFAECLRCIDHTISIVMRDPLQEGTALTRPPLENYRKKKFHSTFSPPRHVHPDLRLVYRYDPREDVPFVLGVGLRHPRSADDVYVRLNVRAIEPSSLSES
ncbi:MAG: hypothetical protein C7B45_04870 [Sulfobacillus acidophilus]|uniref:Uncharacterized protein n=1 Tax=Sulfobacillus acidophilus TaxID=53633 RepID=A0A2T2WL71_9FIRM|nr:MAG: hypothetical protein C7B45_04870 [Sulfobacillus acidophilus]